MASLCSAAVMPNLEVEVPVCQPAAAPPWISGMMRRLTRACWPSSLATARMRASSDSESTLIALIPAAITSRSSPSCLATPLNTICAGAKPAICAL
ncbi:hypothetical protein FQZ97_872000 [compost metagenome]